MTETAVVDAFIERVPYALPDVRLFKRTIMAAQIGPRFVKAGIKGQADVYGFYSGVRPAIAIEIEAKALRGVVSEEQKRWAAFCARRGITYLQLRIGRGESSEETVTRWISELQRVLPHPPP